MISGNGGVFVCFVFGAGAEIGNCNLVWTTTYLRYDPSGLRDITETVGRHATHRYRSERIGTRRRGVSDSELKLHRSDGELVLTAIGGTVTLSSKCFSLTELGPGGYHVQNPLTPGNFHTIVAE
jgi:hypothetical protein